MKNYIKELRKKFNKYNIDGYIVPKNDDYFTEYSKVNRLKIILGLGKIGFDSCLRFVKKEHSLKMKDYKFGHGVRYELPNGLILFGAFHPSPRNVNTGRLTFDMMVGFLEQVKLEL